MAAAPRWPRGGWKNCQHRTGRTAARPSSPAHARAPFIDGRSVWRLLPASAFGTPTNGLTEVSPCVPVTVFRCKCVS